MPAATKREPLQIIYKILSVLSNGPLRKTQLMLSANLDTRTVNRYIKSLEQIGLVSRTGVYYNVTESGSRLLSYIDKVISTLNYK